MIRLLTFVIMMVGVALANGYHTITNQHMDCHYHYDSCSQYAYHILAFKQAMFKRGGDVDNPRLFIDGFIFSER